MIAEHDLLRPGFTDPKSLASLTLADWDLLIRQGRSAGVLGRIQALLEESNLLETVPVAPRNHLTGARIVAASQEQLVGWEVHCIERALRPADTEFVLLKGAAYVISQFPFARGRTQSDIDILVPDSKLKSVEAALLDAGWVHVKLDKYDQTYYRESSHELPPLYHRDRATVLDVHHNILPRTGRLHPDPQKLLASAERIPGSKYKRLSRADLVLHASAHMFQSGDLARGLRELTDLDGLIRTLAVSPGFFDELLDRAPEIDLKRPLFYALRYCARFLNTPIPASILARTQVWTPPQPVLRVMDALVERALVPYQGRPTAGPEFARWMLYVRFHWLTMNPLPLARHLFHQSLRKYK
jgi:hypothetical protein